MRAAILTDNTSAAHATLVAAVKEAGTVAELRTLRRTHRLPLRMALQLAAYRPDLVITEGEGASAMLAVAYRAISRHSRLLVHPRNVLGQGPVRRRVLNMTLNRADGVLADRAASGQLGEVLRDALRVFPLSPLHGLEPFLSGPVWREGEEAQRLAYVGPLSPQSGVFDLVLYLAAYAERIPSRRLEIWWFGEGDLAGVLDAQPLPENMTQEFRGPLAADAMAEVFAQCGLLVLPPQAEHGDSPVAEALAAGLVVVGNQRDTQARHYLLDSGLGWVFDPRRPAAMLEAVGQALDSTPAQLDRMRACGRALVRQAAAQDVSDQLQAALAAIMPEAVLRPAVADSAAVMDRH